MPAMKTFDSDVLNFRWHIESYLKIIFCLLYVNEPQVYAIYFRLCPDYASRKGSGESAHEI